MTHIISSFITVIHILSSFVTVAHIAYIVTKFYHPYRGDITTLLLAEISVPTIAPPQREFPA
jgi:ABC-type glycerol-3-phosphate transport system permease component